MAKASGNQGGLVVRLGEDDRGAVGEDLSHPLTGTHVGRVEAKADDSIGTLRDGMIHKALQRDVTSFLQGRAELDNLALLEALERAFEVSARARGPHDEAERRSRFLQDSRA